MKLLIVCGALFVATFASPVAEPTAEAAPTADAHLLYYGHYGLGSYYGLGHYYGHYGFPYAYWGRKKREATAAADPHYGYGGWHSPYYGYAWPYYHGYYWG